MYSTLLTVALFFAPALASYAINEPELVQCKTARISWPKTKAPYNVIAVAAATPCAEPLVDIGDFEKSFVDWQVTLAAGTVVQLSVADSEDAEAWTGNITVTGGDNKSCLPGGAASASGSSPLSSSTSNSLTGSSSQSNTGTTDSKGNSELDPIGAANAGTNKFLDSAAPSARQLSQPILALGAVTAILAMAL